MTTATYTQEARPLGIETPLGPDVLLLAGLTGTEQLSRLFSFDLRLLSTKNNLAPKDIVGKNVTFFIERLDGEPRYFNGYVKRFAYRGSDDRLSKYDAEVVPWLWFLTRNTDCRLFLGKTAPKIIEEVFTGLGFTDFETAEVKGTHPAREFCVQYRETDFDFVSRLMEEEGIFYYFRHENGKHTLVLADHKGAYKDCPDKEVEMATSLSELSNMISTWEHQYEFRTGKFAHTDYNFETPSAPMLAGEPTLLKLENVDKFERFEYPGRYIKKDDGTVHAKVRMEEEELGFNTVLATGKCRTFFAGGKFKLTEHAAKLEPGEYVITSIQHAADYSAIYDSGRSGAPAEYVNSFTCIPAAVTFRPPRITPRPVVHGTQTAVVVGPEGAEIHTDKYGRVKVHFHWDRYNKPDENASCWIRVAQVWAGKNWGSMFIPRIGQEVVVDFLEGDPDRPLIVGRVYHDESMPPYNPEEFKTMSTIKTLSSPDGGGFNELRFEDKKDKEQIFIHAQRRMDIRVRGNLYETNYGNREMRVGWEKDGEQGGDLNTLVKNDVNTHLKKGHFVQVEKDENRTIEGEVIDYYKKNHSIKVDETARLNSKEFIVETGDVISLKTKEVKVEASDKVGVRGGTIHLESTTGVHIKCGGNFVVIDSSGVSINGMQVKINSGGSASPASSADAAEVPELELPFDAAVADDGKPGKKGGVGGGTRTRTKVNPGHIKAPTWKPPPEKPSTPTTPGVVPPVTPESNKKLLTVEWVEKETWCSEPGTLKGTTENYADAEDVPGEVRKAVDGETVKSVSLPVQGNSFNQDVDVVDMLPEKVGSSYEESRDLDGFAEDKKTPKPLKLRFIPNLAKSSCSKGRFSVATHFDLSAKDYELLIASNIKYIKGWAREIIDLGASAPAGTGGVIAGTFYGQSNWRWAQINGAGNREYWNGTAWAAVPATWSDPTGTNLYGAGVWQSGSNYPSQFGANFPQALPDWNIDAASVQQTLKDWSTAINDKWSYNFDVKRDGCRSADAHCCRYSMIASVGWTKVTTKDNDTVILAEGSIRANATMWPLGERPTVPAHEWGHHLGNPDEYAGQQVASYQDAADGLVNGLDSTSVMGSSMNTVKKRHYGAVIDHLAKMVKDQYGRTYTYQCVPGIC